MLCPSTPVAPHSCLPAPCLPDLLGCVCAASLYLCLLFSFPIVYPSLLTLLPLHPFCYSQLIYPKFYPTFGVCLPDSYTFLLPSALDIPCAFLPLLVPALPFPHAFVAAVVLVLFLPYPLPHSLLLAHTYPTPAPSYLLTDFLLVQC